MGNVLCSDMANSTTSCTLSCGRLAFANTLVGLFIVARRQLRLRKLDTGLQGLSD